MNVVIYSETGSSDFANLIKLDDETELREFDLSELENYKQYNPSVLVLDMELNKVREFCAVRKLEFPVLVPVNEIPDGLTIRALSYDFIKKPINETELNVRLNALLKTYSTKRELLKTAMCDELTGLYNRKYLHLRLDSEISRAKRYGTNLSCLLLDIDYFKIVNDMYGYDWGDILLRKIAQMLSALVRKEDVLTRYGDEEFIIILPETTEQQAMIFAERFRRDVEKMEFIPANEEERHPITISGGISSFPCMEAVEENSNTLIRYAEHALYNAKQSGKNKIVEFSKMNLGC
ncbi:MAG: GGDEF domain-containing protein [Candidatus Gastranaerophilales bacterium]|nr:GGDEF domain-containing protein [Candidatus Gastranaerophilales bacterium]